MTLFILTINDKTPGFCFSGFLIMILIPRFMNGFEKSIKRSRVEEMVNGATAKSASYKSPKIIGYID